MEQERRRFLDRPVRLKWLVYVVVALVVIGLALYGVTAWQQAKLRGQARDQVRDDIEQKGRALAQTIAVTSREDVLNRNYDALQNYFSDLAALRDVSYLAVVTLDGRAVVHTNARFRGRDLDDEVSREAVGTDEMLVQDVKDDRVYDVAVPVMSFTRKAAVVRVGVSYARAAEAFRG